jgi:hypothetical protein
MQHVSFVGFIVTPEWVEMEPDRVWTIAEWPEPVSHCDLQDFLGFASFYRSFISSFLRLMKPMTDRL